MAQAAPLQATTGFAGFLQEIARELGATSYPPIHWLLIRSGMELRERDVERWWNGKSEPWPKRRKPVLDAIQAALPKFDVWECYTRHLQQGFELSPREAGGNVTRLRRPR